MMGYLQIQIRISDSLAAKILVRTVQYEVVGPKPTDKAATPLAPISY
jgi:hypothetical protein